MTFPANHVPGDRGHTAAHNALEAALNAQPRDLSSFVTLGDSRTGYDGGVVEARPGETSIYTSDRGIFAWARVLLRHRMRWLKNGGVGGDTVAQMRVRVPDLLALDPGWVLGFGHINSVSAGVSAAAIISDLDGMFDEIAASGARIVWGTDWVASTTTTAGRAVSYAVNDWLRAQVGVRPGFYLAEYQSVMVDPTTGNPRTGYASDGLHQDGIGPRACADMLVRILDPLVPRSDRLIASNDDPTNLIPNGMMVGGTTYATSWANNGTGSQAVVSKVARTDGLPGDWQQVVVTSGTDYALRNRVAAGTTGSWVVGDTVYAECEFETDASGWNPTEFNLNVALYNTPVGAVTRSADMLHLNSVPASIGRAASGIFRTPPITVPTGTSHVELNVALRGSGTYRIARARIARVVNP